MDQILPGLSHAPNLHPIVVHFYIALWCRHRDQEAEVHDRGAQPPSHEHPPERESEPRSEDVAGEPLVPAPPHSDEASSASSEESPGSASAEPCPQAMRGTVIVTSMTTMSTRGNGG